MVTGVSRSGRIRKKSSKLADFTDEIEPRPKKVPKSPKILSNSGYSPDIKAQGIKSEIKPKYLDFESDVSVPNVIVPDVDMDDDFHIKEEEEVDITDELPENGTEDDEDDGQIESPAFQQRVPQRSIYMTEKSSKKQKMLKDGTIVLSKAQRKDKGKPRFTAYMLWSKEARQQIMSTNPETDFASASKRLGEMWANVPSNQKYLWKKRAKRLQTRIKKNAAKALAEQNSKKYLAPKPMSASTARRAAKRMESEEQLKEQRSHLPLNKKTAALINASQGESTKTLKPPTFRPVDVAAHLKLLGDNMETIGQRLKEHEGQITVSGSLSVLLDSLLCSLGPLVCLTTHIPEVGEKLQHLGPTFSNTLDNIAYVMPGL